LACRDNKFVGLRHFKIQTGPPIPYRTIVIVRATPNFIERGIYDGFDTWGLALAPRIPLVLNVSRSHGGPPPHSVIRSSEPNTAGKLVYGCKSWETVNHNIFMNRGFHGFQAERESETGR
jgi:hypothetical protein